MLIDGFGYGGYGWGSGGDGGGDYGFGSGLAERYDACYCTYDAEAPDAR